MDCKCCKKEMRIVSAKNVYENNVFFREVGLVCSNKECTEFKKLVIIQRPLKVEIR